MLIRRKEQGELAVEIMVVAPGNRQTHSNCPQLISCTAEEFSRVDEVVEAS
jgi:hypothetical protein